MENIVTIHDQAAEAIERLLAPVSEASPCGSDVSYDPDYVELKDEIDKIGEGEAADFDRITRIATEILKVKSKDLRVAVYLAIGLARTKREAGVAEGLAVVRALIERYWDDLRPTKVSRRVPVLGFLASNLAAWTEHDDNKRHFQNGEALQHAASECEKLGAMLSERLADKAPPMARLERALRGAIPKTAPEKQPSGPQKKLDEDAGAGEPGIGAVHDDNGATRTLYQIASYFRNSDPTNPISYKIVRAARWRAIIKTPPAEAGTTKLPPPASARIDALRKLSSDGNWAILRLETEIAMQEPGFQFWLELQQIAHNALLSSGSEYLAAADAVVAETVQLLGRVPELVDLSFSDGTPFVPHETREWIDEHSSGSDEDSKSGRETDEVLMEVVRNARTLASDGKLSEALATLSRAAGSARSGAKRFAYDLEKARLLRKSGNDPLARNVLAELDRRITRCEIDKWDPDAAVELWTEMIAAFGKLASKRGPEAEAAKRTIDGVMAGLTRIDVNAALKLS